MNVTVDISSNRVLPRLMEKLGPAGRRELHAVAADDLAVFIAGHIRAYANSKHRTAQAFGARPTGHYTKGLAAIGTSATEEEGVVTIPIPGLSRAWHDLEIRPHAKKALTLPLASAGETVYGKTVAELRALGWNFYSVRKDGGAEGVLFGYRGEGENRETKAMFVLRTLVRQARDPSLMPSEEDISRRASNAIVTRVMDAVRRARRERDTK